MQQKAGGGRLVAVVVTCNRLEKLKPTLARLLAAPAAELAALVVVDNASSDGTAAWLAALDDPRLRVLQQPENRGGAGGFEDGMRLALARCAPDWLVVMDDDARPAPGALAAFHARAARPGGPAGAGEAALAAAVHFPDGRICEMNRPGLNPFRNPRALARALLGQGRAGYHLADAAYRGDVLQPIDQASFVGLFLPAAMVRAAGLPDGRLFLYGDDVLYCLGLRARGFTLLFDPAIRFEHDCSTFADDYRRRFAPLWKVYYTYRNGLLMYRRAAGPLFWPLLPLLWVKWHRAAARYGPERATYLRLMRRALRDALARRLETPHAAILALAGSGPAEGAAPPAPAPAPPVPDPPPGRRRLSR